MRKLTNFALFMVLAMLVTLASCKKDDPEPDDDEIEYSKPNDRAASAEVDEAIDQVNDMINNNIGGGWSKNLKVAVGADYNLPCGLVSVDSSTNIGGKTVYKLNYGDKTQCGYKYKSGLISFALESTSGSFDESGAVFKITFTDYVVEVKATGSYVKLNGTISVTNDNGGFVWEVLDGSTVVTHSIRGTLNITYYDNTTRQRSYFQERVWSSPGGDWENLRLSIDGDSLDASSNKVCEVGYTYEGDYEFVTTVSTPFLWTNCSSGTTATWAGPYKLNQGQAKLDVVIPTNPIITSLYFDVKAGYYWNYSLAGSTPAYEGDCDANAYEITTVLNGASTKSYQLY